MRKLGLALSGGGYRAVAFHLGTMRKLNDLGILEKIEVISSVSGGSIISADYLLHLNKNKSFQEFENRVSEKLQKSIIGHVLKSRQFILLSLSIIAFLTVFIYIIFNCGLAWLGIIVLLLGFYLLMKYQFVVFPVSKIIEKIYDDFFFEKATLKDLRTNNLILAINATNLQSGRQFTFSQGQMGDSSYSSSQDKFNGSDFPIARAVMASSAVPGAFTPIKIDRSFFNDPEDYEKIMPVLVDGGIYDNQGIHKLTQPSQIPFYNNPYECSTVITSDAGNKISVLGNYENTITLLLRCMDLFMNRIKMFQIIQNIYFNTRHTNREIAYISLGWDLDKCISGFVDNLRKGNITDSVVRTHKINLSDSDENISKLLKTNLNYSEIIGQQLSSEQLKIAREVGTNLTALTKREIEYLSKHAESQTELQVRLYCPSLLNEAKSQ